MTDALAIPERSVEELIAQVKKIQEVQQAVMKEGEHYGVIPGTNKPTLLKPGAEKLAFVFRLDPQYDSVDHYDGAHLTVKSKCTLWHIGSGLRMGSGEGSCSTKETKYAFRHAARKCPTCGKEAIIKGKEEYGGGWLCFKKKDGCGAKFKDGDGKIETQEAGQVANENLADVYNTVLKMSNKRALVAAVLNVTAASDIFTQDLEDYQGAGGDTQGVKPSVSGAAEPASPAMADSGSETTPAPGFSENARQDKDFLLGRIKAVADKMGMLAKERAVLWQKHCQHATPETVDQAALADLYAALVALSGKK